MNSSPFAGPWLCRAFIGTLSSVLVLGLAGAAQAQSTIISNTPSVVVDLSVLDALGPAGSTSVLSPTTTPSPAPAPPVSTRGLLEPPAAPPVSRLNVPTPTSPVRPPRPAAAPTQAVATGRPAPVAAPEPPAAPAVAAPAPAVQTAGRPPATTTPAPTAAPPTPVANPPSASATVAPAAPARAELRPPTQVPEPPKPPEVPAVAPEPPPAPVVTAPPSVAEEPAAEPAAPVAPQVAAVPSAEEAPELRLEFEAGSARLPDDGRQPLQQLATQLDDEADMRVQLRAYAGGTAETSSLARRLSLSRALAVRSYLIEQGVRSTRMDVRALGNKSGDGPEDRVDIVLVAQ